MRYFILLMVIITSMNLYAKDSDATASQPAIMLLQIDSIGFVHTIINRASFLSGKDMDVYLDIVEKQSQCLLDVSKKFSELSAACKTDKGTSEVATISLLLLIQHSYNRKEMVNLARYFAENCKDKYSYKEALVFYLNCPVDWCELKEELDVYENYVFYIK